MFRRTMTIPAAITERLVTLAKQALDSRDVPIAAVVLYDGAIIGEGWNTVLADSNAGGHAEINAISDAMRQEGKERFDALDRSKLVLISTFEPCLMCIGACLNASIRNVGYLQPKEWRDLAAERKGFILHFLRRSRVKNSGEQLALFRLHPDFAQQRGYK